MNFEEAQACFVQHHSGNETAEETYNRLTGMPNSRQFHQMNNAAIATIRSHQPPSTSQRINPIAFIQQFAAVPKGRVRAPPSIDDAVPISSQQQETKEERNKRLNRERVQRSRAKKSATEREAENQRKAENMRRLRSQETAEERDARLATDAVSHSQRRAEETPEERDATSVASKRRTTR